MATNQSKALLAVVALGAVLLIIGVTAYLAGGAAASETAVLTVSDATPVEPVQWWGMAIGAVGALLLSGALGYVLGRRGGAHGSRGPRDQRGTGPRR